MRATLVLLILPLLAFQCDKNAVEGCLRGKVVRVTCASFVIQVLNNDSIGDDGWKDSMNNSTAYDNVFRVSNKCKIPDSYKAGDTFYFTIEKPEQNDCIVCMMYDAPPNSEYQIKNISAKSCD